MRRLVVLFLLLMVAFVSVVQAQTPATAPKPDPEIKKLQVLVGHWTYEGEHKPGPLGPGGKVSGEYTGQWRVGGFILEGSMVEKSGVGTTRILEIDEYTPMDKTIHWTNWASNGGRTTGTITMTGNTITWDGKFTVNGKEYRVREPYVLSADNMSATGKADISADDGKTWTPWIEATFTKTKPAAKK